jgi:uncharacterized protein (DUF433 family)
MSTEPSQVVEVQQTEHPYSVRVPGICGGRPTIKGTRIAVQFIADTPRRSFDYPSVYGYGVCTWEGHYTDKSVSWLNT